MPTSCRRVSLRRAESAGQALLVESLEERAATQCRQDRISLRLLRHRAPLAPAGQFPECLTGRIAPRRACSVTVTSVHTIVSCDILHRVDEDAHGDRRKDDPPKATRGAVVLHKRAAYPRIVDSSRRSSAGRALHS